MALDTIPKQEGGKLKAVASGTLPSGQPVVVNSDGTVSVVAGNDTTLGSEQTLQTVFTSQCSVASDTNSARVVVAWRYVSNAGVAAVGTVSGSSISFGSNANFKSGDCSYVDAAFDGTNDKVVIVYQDGANSSVGTAVVGTVSGTSISFGTPVVFESGAVLDTTVTFDPDTGKFVVSYCDFPDGGALKAIVGTVSGTSISFGSPVTYTASTAVYGSGSNNICYDTNNNKVVVVYADGGNSNYLTAKVGTVSGTSISFGSATVIDTSNNAAWIGVSFDTTSNKVVVAYALPTSGAAAVLSVSGTAITAGSPVTFNTQGVNLLDCAYDGTTDQTVIVYRQSANSDLGTYIAGSVSGTSISFGSETVFNDGATGPNAIGYNADQGGLVLAYRDGSDSNYMKSRVLQPGSTNLTSENYIGMSGGVVVAGGSAEQEIGTPSVFESDGVETTSSVYDSTSQKVVIAYREIGAFTYYGTAVVGTVSGTSISFGTPVVFESASTNFISATFDSTTNKVVIAYKDEGNSNYGTAVVGTVSGTSISFGTPVVFESASTSDVSATYDANAQKVVIAYKDFANSQYGTAIVGTVSGTSISFGTAVVFESATTEDCNIVYDSNAQKVVIAYQDKGNSDYGTAIVGTVSGTSISFGIPAVFESAASRDYSLAYDSNGQNIVIAYTDTGNSNYGTAVIGAVSGTSISFGSPTVFESAASFYVSATYDANAQRIVISYRDDGNSSYGTAVTGTVSGTSISFGTPAVFESATSQYISSTYDESSQKIVISYQDLGNSKHGTSVVFQTGYSDITRGEVADGDNATIDIVGTVSTNQVGLTAGQQYYVQTDGTIDTTPADPSVLAGTAVSATKMVVKS